MALDLDLELGALGKHFLAGELDLLRDRVHADRVTRLARWRRGRRGGLRDSSARLRLRAIAAAAATPAPPLAAPSACFAVLGRLRIGVVAALGLLRVLAGTLLVAGDRLRDRLLLLVDLWKIVESAREDDRGRVRGDGLPPAAPALAPAALSARRLARRLLALALRVPLLDVGGEALERWKHRPARAVGLDRVATLVVAVDLDAVGCDRVADAHLDPLREEILELAHRASARREERPRDLRGADHLDACHPRRVEGELDAPHRVGRDRVGHADLAEARAVRAVHVVRLADARAHALARQLDDAEVADLGDRRLRTVLGQVLLEALLDVAAMLRRAHVDEVAHDHAAEVAQAQLPRDLVDGLLVGLVRVRLAVARAARAARVDIDGDERLGLVEHQRAARRKRHLAGVDQVDLPLGVEGVEDRSLAVVEMDLRRRLGRDHLEERLRAVERGLAVDDDAVDRCVDRVADRAQQDVALRIELAGGADGLHALLHHIPEPREVLRVAGELRARRLEARGAQDEAEALAQVERVEDLAHPAPAVLVVDLAADADIVHVGHHDEEASWDRQIARDRRTLRAEALLEDLHHDLLAALEGVLHERARAAGDLAPDLLRALGRIAVLALPAALRSGEVLGVEVGDVEESVRALAEVDEGGLDRGLDIHDAGLVDRADVRRSRGALGVELAKAPLIEDRDAHLVARRIVDDHELTRLLAAMRNELRLLALLQDLALGGRCVEGAHRGACIRGRRFLGVLLRLRVGFGIRVPDF